MFKFVYLLVVGFIVNALHVKADVSNSQYALMPELFYLDNFDQCMLREKEALFCTFTFLLKPSGNSSTLIWDIIKNVSAHPQNYKHDRLRHGICVPQTCGTEFNNRTSIEDVIEECYNQKYKQFGLKGTVTNLTCQNDGSGYTIDVYDISFGILVALYISFVIAASVYERYVRTNVKLQFYEKSTVSLCIAAFSVPRNWARLRSVNSSADHRKLRSIQGIRFYNMICVIMSHTVMRVLGGPVSNPQYTENSTKEVMKMFLANGWYAVQTFFVISGWLLSYHIFCMKAENKPFKLKFIFWGILNRYIRLAPALAFMVGFHATWLVHLSKGPYWDMFVGEEHRNCRKNWWANMLFVNNYVDNNNMCLHQTWYIAADMQLFVYSVVLLYVISKYPSKLKHIFGISLFVGFVLPGVFAYVNKYDIVIRAYPEILYNLNVLRQKHWHVLYSSGYSNIFGYTAGMISGYLFFTHRNTCLNIRRVHVILWWLLTFGMCLFVVLISVVFFDSAFNVTPLRSAIYWSCGKNLFALGIAVGIFGFTQKMGWFARWVCEFQPVQVLGRLTYSTYIIHTAIIRWEMGYNRYPSSANDSIMFVAVLGDVTLSYLAGTLLCLLVEMPVSALQKSLGVGVSRNRSTVKMSSEKSLETLDMNSDVNN